MRIRTKLLWIIILTAAATLLTFSTIFAEGEEPASTPADDPAVVVVETPPTTQEETPISEEVITESEEAPTQELQDPSAALEESPVEVGEETVPEESVEESLPSAASEDSTSIVELASDLAETGTELVDETGQVLDMASQSSADIIAAADPYFTYAGTTYRFLATVGACAAYPGDVCADGLANPIQVAVDYVRDNATPPVGGTIYVEKATYVGAVSIDCSLGNLSTLTKLQGNPDAGIKPTISGTLTISNITNGFWLDSFIVTGGVTIKDSTSTGEIKVTNVTGALNLTDLSVTNTSGSGITVSGHSGNITTTRVKSSGNHGNGMNLENSAAGTVTVTNSSCDHNNPGSGGGYFGLYIDSNGIITIDGFSGSRNNGYGLSAVDFSKLIVKNSVFNENIDPEAAGNGIGIYVYDPTNSALVTMDSVIANNNILYGIYIQTAGSAALNKIEASHNGSMGTYLDVKDGTGTVSISNSKFTDNTGNGLDVESRRAITLTSVQAYDNVGNGVYLNNCQYIGSACTGSGNVTITSPAAGGSLAANEFYENTSGSGVNIVTNGNVILTNLNSYDNSGDGIYIINNYGPVFGSITINKNLPNWVNSIDSNTQYGIELYTAGNVTISDTDAGQNGYSGIYFNSYGKTVSISRGDFDYNGNYGLYVLSSSSVTLVDVSANYNDSSRFGTYDGVHIVSNASTGTVTIKSSSAGTRYEFDSNSGDGIDISSRGTISVSNANAYLNLLNGLLINTTSAPGTPAVTVKECTFNSNAQSGINIASRGNVTLTNVSAVNNDTNHSDSNYYNGVKIDNTSGTGSVTINSTLPANFYEFSGNTANGILVDAKGAVSIGNVIATDNGQDGLYVTNTYASGTPGITVIKGHFDSNGYHGMQLLSNGNLVITDSEAYSNDTNHSDTNYYHGALINNSYGTGNVTISSSSSSTSYYYNDNTSDGIYIYSHGTVSVSNVIASENGAMGIRIDNSVASSAKNVTVARCVMSSNPQYGLSINTIGSVTLDSIKANENGESGEYSGVFVDACQYSGGCRGTGTVTLKGSENEFKENTAEGLVLNAFGSISIQNFTASYNNKNGVFLNTLYPGSTSGITITASTGNWNYAVSDEKYGIEVYTYGTISISRLNANWNAKSGAYLDNDGATTPKSVTVTDCYFNSNEGTGVEIFTNGMVTFNGVDSSYNSVHESSFDEDTGTTIYERLTSDTGYDKWWFTGELHDAYTIELLDTQFAGVLALYDKNNSLIAYDDTGTTSNYGTAVKIVITDLAATNDYYLRIASSDGNGGDYTLSFNSGSTLSILDRYGAKITNSSSNAGLTVKSTSNVWSSFDENGMTGLFAYFPGNTGPISITNMDAKQNGDRGMDFGTIAGNVSIINNSSTRTSSYNGNTSNGIYINTQGTITLTGRIYINENGDNGAYLANYLASTPKTVTVSGVTANDNYDRTGGSYGTGLGIETYGNISLTSITANGNNSWGVFADNYQSGSGSGNLTITGSNNMSNNGKDGLYARTKGIASLTGITCEYNDRYGIDLAGYGTAKATTLKNIIAQYNDRRGISVGSSGILTLDGVKTIMNGVGFNEDGMNLASNGYAAVIKNSCSIGNEGHGIYVNTYGGTFTLTNTSYFGNDTNVSGDEYLQKLP